MQENNYFIELHLLQNFVPSNLNRDDTGSPKDTMFGGFRRGRISSQCLKRATRECKTFEEMTGVENGKRTKLLLDYISEPLKEKKIINESNDKNAMKIVKYFVEKFYSKFEKSHPDKVEVLIYISEKERELICQGLEEIINNSKSDPESDKLKKEEEKAIDGITTQLKTAMKNVQTAPDIALFGRMLASYPEKNIEASCQVAHAISTNTIAMDMDFYTALDDLQKDDAQGAAMMGFSGFNSSCYYRYSRINKNDLKKNLKDDEEITLKTIEAFIRSTIEAVPTGKQNAHAHHNPPDFIMVVIRNHDQGWNLANAFEKPIKPTHTKSLMESSIESLLKYYYKLKTSFGNNSKKEAKLEQENTFFICLNENVDLGELKKAQVNNVDELIEKIKSAMK